MSFPGDIRAYLGASADLKELVDERIYPQVFPKNAALPGVLYTIIDMVPQGDLDGHDRGLWICRVQIDCYSLKYDEAHAMADYVKAALPNDGERFKAVADTRSDLYEEQRRVHRVTSDFSIHWVEP